MTHRDERYLSLVRQQPCASCAAPAPSDPHHFAGGRGTGTKCSDYYTVALCRRCHDAFHQAGTLAPASRTDTMLMFWRFAAQTVLRYFLEER